jgi:hypothetical protein
MIDYSSSIDDTDKFRGGILIDGKAGHNYKNMYQQIFLTKPQTILEIGTASCGFAKFLKSNNIGTCLVGADKEKGIVSHHIPSRLTWCDLFDDFYVGDVSRPEFIDWIRNKNYTFDLIIDDASHDAELQKHLVSTVTEFLSPNGVYVVEDIGSYDTAVMLFSCLPNHLKINAIIYDSRLSINRLDDLCLVIDLRNL